MADTVSFFLGANTPYGFVSFFDELYNPYGDDRALIIKGGPGTGKSGIIKAIATKRPEITISFVFFILFFSFLTSNLYLQCPMIFL